MTFPLGLYDKIFVSVPDAEGSGMANPCAWVEGMEFHKDRHRDAPSLLELAVFFDKQVFKSRWHPALAERFAILDPAAFLGPGQHHGN